MCVRLRSIEIIESEMSPYFSPCEVCRWFCDVIGVHQFVTEQLRFVVDFFLQIRLELL